VGVAQRPVAPTPILSVPTTAASTVTASPVTAKQVQPQSDDAALNILWNRVSEAVTNCDSLTPTHSAVIRQNVFLLLSAEYLRIRSHPQRKKEFDVAQFIQMGGTHIDALCRAKAEQFALFEKGMRERVNREFETKIAKVREESAELTRHRYEYVYNPPQAKQAVQSVH